MYYLVYLAGVKKFPDEFSWSDTRRVVWVLLFKFLRKLVLLISFFFFHVVHEKPKDIETLFDKGRVRKVFNTKKKEKKKGKKEKKQQNLFYCIRGPIEENLNDSRRYSYKENI